MKRRSVHFWSKLLLAAVFLGLALWFLRRDFHKYNYRELAESLGEVPPRQAVMALLLTWEWSVPSPADSACSIP